MFIAPNNKIAGLKSGYAPPRFGRLVHEIDTATKPIRGLPSVIKRINKASIPQKGAIPLLQEERSYGNVVVDEAEFKDKSIWPYSHPGYRIAVRDILERKITPDAERLSLFMGDIAVYMAENSRKCFSVDSLVKLLAKSNIPVDRAKLKKSLNDLYYQHVISRRLRVFYFMKPSRIGIIRKLYPEDPIY